MQRVIGVPSLHVNKNNRFSCLKIDDIPEQEDLYSATPTVTTNTKSQKRKRWEMRLPSNYQITTMPSSKSLRIKVQLQTTDTAEIHGVEGLVDCGADGEFIDSDYVCTNCIATQTLTRAIPVNNVDGTPNDNGPIREVVDLVLRYKGHSERRVFAVTHLGKE